MTSEQLSRLMTMHTYCRPAGETAEAEFVTRYIHSLGVPVTVDRHRNLHIQVGTAPRLCFAAHLDTVSYHDGRQRVTLSSDGIIALHPSHQDRQGKRDMQRQCLGADDTAGVFLLTEMIRAGVPGLYLFHHGEEMGCIGSSALADDDGYAHLWPSLDAVISFDRKGPHDVITHQSMARTASDAFAYSFAKLVQGHGLVMAPSPNGSYTDSKEYAYLVPECTNIAVGYLNQHGPDETLDTKHIDRLLGALLSVDLTRLTIARDPEQAYRHALAERERWLSQRVQPLSSKPYGPVYTLGNGRKVQWQFGVGWVDAQPYADGQHPKVYLTRDEIHRLDEGGSGYTDADVDVDVYPETCEACGQSDCIDSDGFCWACGAYVDAEELTAEAEAEVLGRDICLAGDDWLDPDHDAIDAALAVAREIAEEED